MVSSVTPHAMGYWVRTHGAMALYPLLGADHEHCLKRQAAQVPGTVHLCLAASALAESDDASEHVPISRTLPGAPRALQQQPAMGTCGSTAGVLGGVRGALNAE